ncbi:MAG: NAD(P)H-binding protein [Limosilactobacillus sp.]
MKILILAATGRVADKLIPKLIDDNELTLFGHNVTERLSKYQGKARLLDGDLNDEAAVRSAAEGQELAVLNFMVGTKEAQHVVNAMADTACRRLVVTTGHCSPDETKGGQLISSSSLDTTCIYMPWIRDNTGKNGYQVVADDPQQENFEQVSHEGVARFIADLTKNLHKYANEDISLTEA